MLMVVHDREVGSCSPLTNTVHTLSQHKTQSRTARRGRDGRGRRESEVVSCVAPLSVAVEVGMALTCRRRPKRMMMSGPASVFSARPAQSWCGKPPAAPWEFVLGGPCVGLLVVVGVVDAVVVVR